MSTICGDYIQTDYDGPVCCGGRGFLPPVRCCNYRSCPCDVEGIECPGCPDCAPCDCEECAE
jgi:hypothetical protein